MSMKRLFVCLLVLAGSATVFLAERGRTSGSARPRELAVIAVRTQPQEHDARYGARRADFRSPENGIPEMRAGSSDLIKPAAPGNSAVAIPMTFEQNVGQADSIVKFIGRGKGLTVFLGRQGIAVQVAKPKNAGLDSPFRAATGSDRDGVMTLTMAGGANFDWHGEEKLRGESNYFIGNDPRAWRTRVPNFARAESANLARGIGIAIYGNENGVEYDLRVAPKGDVAKLRLLLAGARDLRVDNTGDLLMNVGGEELRMKPPVIYEEVHTRWHSSRPRRRRALGAGRAKKYSPRTSHRTPGSKARGKSSTREPKPKACNPKTQGGIPCPAKTFPPTGASSKRKTIEGGYVIESDNSIGFRVGPYDANATLVIDPSLSIAYESFLGGAGSDTAASVAVDASGKIYVSGTTTSATTFPELSGNRIGPADGPAEFFVAKIDPALQGADSLVYLTFLGGSGTQAGGLVAVDNVGNAAITGTTTATDFPVTDSSQPTSALASGYGNDVIVSEIGPTGSTLVFSTLFGGSGTQSQVGSGGIALDPTGDVYIATDTHTTPIDSVSTDLPVTPGAFQSTWDGKPGDAFLAIFQPPSAPGGAATLKYCSYIGTNSIGPPGVGGLAVDAYGNAYIAGFTSNSVSGFPTKNAVQSSYGGGISDAFLMKISPGGLGAQDVVYSTLLGGSGADRANGVAIDSSPSPNAYIVGTTQSTNFPTNGVTGAYSAGLHPNATANMFLSVVAQNAISGQASLAYSTYLGGSQADSGLGVAVSAPNAVYITGATTSWDFPWRDNLQPFNGAGDAFLAKMDTTSPGAASLIYLTPLGGTSPEGGTASTAGNAVAADHSGNAFVTGATTSADFPTALTTSGGAHGFQPACISCQQSPPASDAFVTKIAESAGQAPSVYFNIGKVIFPAAAIGTANAPQLVAVLNGGEGNLTISDIAIIGANAGDFSLIGSNVCLGQTIGPGSGPKCSFEVGFTSSVVGPEAAVVSVTDNAPGSPQILELIGGGQGPLAQVSPATADFGSQPVSSTSQGLTITLTNAGNQALVVAGVTQGGPDVAQFSVSGGGSVNNPFCQVGISLSSGNSCAVKVTFSPISTRAYHSEIDFIDNSGQVANAQQAVQLTGVGTATAPIVVLSASSLSFPNQTVGSASGPQSVTLTNQGSAALSITGIALTGANAGDFQIAATGTTCPVTGGTVLIGANCTVAVRMEHSDSRAEERDLDLHRQCLYKPAAGEPVRYGNGSVCRGSIARWALVRRPRRGDGERSPSRNDHERRRHCGRD